MLWKPKTKLNESLATKFWMNTKIFEILVTHSCHKDKPKSVWKFVLLSRIKTFLCVTTHRGAAASFFSPLTSATGPRTVFSLVVVLCFRSWLSARHLSQESAGTNISVAGTLELSESLLTICLGRSSCHFLLSLLLSAHWGYVTCAPASCWPCLSAWASLFFSVYLCFCVRPNLCQCPQCWQQGYVFKFMHKGAKVSDIPDCLLAFKTLIKISYFGTFAACNIWSNCQKAFWPMPDWSSSHLQICWFYNYFVNLLLNHQKI